MSERSSSAVPEVSVVLPVFNDESWIGQAIESCRVQSLSNIEIIVVDDASTDGTVEVVESLRAADSRIRLIRQAENGSALKARRAGILAAASDYVMFLDGDDELALNACEAARSLAVTSGADVVGFGSYVVSADGTTGSSYEASMQPRYRELDGGQILEKLFPLGQTAQGQLWRYLFSREVLLKAYAGLESDLELPRMNDLPLAFLAMMHATRYVSMPDRLYRYYFRRGASGHQVSDWSDYIFNASALDSVQAIGRAVDSELSVRPDRSDLQEVYGSVRLSVVGRVLDYVSGIRAGSLRDRAFADLKSRVGFRSVALACADFCPKALPAVAYYCSPAELRVPAAGHVVLRTGNLRTGGVQGVVVSQAEYLRRAGYKVTILLDSDSGTIYELPDGVDLSYLHGSTIGQKVAYLLDFCQVNGVDAVIDHHVFYNDRWPYFSTALSAINVPVVGWIHNFAMRPLLDEVSRISFMSRYLQTLSNVIVLSESDVAFWKLRGVERVAYLPNPPSPLAEKLAGAVDPRSAPTEKLEIVWWGRLQQRTKQVLDLVDIGAELRQLGIDFGITIIGPDSSDLTAKQIQRRSRSLGISENVVLTGPLHGDDLVDRAKSSHVFVSTSIIEGYPLALVEAQAMGLPIAMYQLPWLEFIKNNQGVICVEQGDRPGLASELADLLSNKQKYVSLSQGAVAAVRNEASDNLAAVYADLLSGELDERFSPEPTIASMRLLLDQNSRFVERMDRVHRRELNRKSAEVDKQKREFRAVSQRVSRPSALVQKPPMIPRVKSLLQRFLPATMRQAAYYARHDYSAMQKRHEQVVNNQLALSHQINQLQAEIKSRKK
ncbi:glycosyltransferase [Brevibacterium sp. LE-L]|uniref:glycosyltransferase n=1 Tax=Brevibacterium sp. LE-L TaxID=3418557 RepID=UPI003CE8E24F